VILRLILEALVAVLLISLLRSVIGIIGKALFRQPEPAPAARQRPSVPSGGELKKDPVCGTFISPASAVQKKVGPEVYYFCSPECRDKFRK
jgi:YHS domain-containing protein